MKTKRIYTKDDVRSFGVDGKVVDIVHIIDGSSEQSDWFIFYYQNKLYHWEKIAGREFITIIGDNCSIPEFDVLLGWCFRLYLEGWVFLFTFLYFSTRLCEYK